MNLETDKKNERPNFNLTVSSLLLSFMYCRLQYLDLAFGVLKSFFCLGQLLLPFPQLDCWPSLFILSLVLFPDGLVVLECPLMLGSLFSKVNSPQKYRYFICQKSNHLYCNVLNDILIFSHLPRRANNNTYNKVLRQDSLFFLRRRRQGIWENRQAGPED